MNIYIIRNNQKFGPYTESALLSYVNNGQVLVQDKAIKDGDLQEHTVSYYLRQCGLRPKVTNKGNILSQLKMIGSELIFPKTTMLSKSFLTDQRFLILAIVGLLPMVIMNMPLGGVLLFYEVSLYFHLGIVLLYLFQNATSKFENHFVRVFLNTDSCFYFMGLHRTSQSKSFLCTCRNIISYKHFRLCVWSWTDRRISKALASYIHFEKN